MPHPLRYIFVDLNSFFASCEQQEEPSLRGRPVAVVPLMSEFTCAIAASYAAKAYGIKTGTNIGQALQMCPDLQIVQARPRKYVEYHHAILNAVDKCIPVGEIRSIDEFFCRLDARQQSPEAAAELAQNIKRVIAEDVGVCLTSSIGVAPNVFLAKVGSNMQKPDGLTIIQHHELPQRLYSLCLTDLPGIGARMARRLYHHGVFDVKTLCSLSTLRMRKIWGGIGGLKFHEQLHGHDWQYAETQKRCIGHQHVLEPALRTPDGGLSCMKQLLTKAAERMRSSGYYCKRLSVDIKLAHHQGYLQRDVAFAETQDTTFLLSELERVWQDFPRVAPHRVGVTLSGLVEAGAHQLSLFDKPKNQALAHAVDTLNQRYGRHTVSFGRTNRMNQQAGGDKIAFQRVPSLYEAHG